MSRTTNASENASADIDRHERSRRFIQNAIELALSFGDFQKEIDARYEPEMVLAETVKRIQSLVRFESAALYLVDDVSSDLQRVSSWPDHHGMKVEAEIAFLIDHGFVAWALRERRGITVFSRDGSRQVLLHVIATYSRIRGLLVGIFPAEHKGLPDASLEILSIVLRNTANALEGLALYSLLGEEKQRLETLVRENTEKVISYEKQLMQAQKSESIAALAGGIAHQFNNALTGLMGNLDLLEMIGGQSPEVAQYIGRLRPLAERMSGLTHQMLTYAHGGHAHPTLVTVVKLIRDVTPAIRRVIRPMTRLTFEAPEETLAVQVDVTQMQMVLLAIVANADEASAGDGEIHLSACRVTSRQVADSFPADRSPEDYVCIGVRDTGEGMDADTLRRVCEPFFSTRAVGRGLGMAAANAAVENNRGWITLSSEKGVGTCASIYLPLVKEVSIVDE